MKIRKFKPNDQKEITEIFRIEQGKSPYNEKWTKDTAKKEIKKLLKKVSDTFVLEVDSEVAGFVMATIEFSSVGKSVYVNELWLKKKFQSKGYGRQLMEHMENYYRKKGAKNVWLITNQKSNAFKFYNKMKYKVAKDARLVSKRL